MTSLLKAILGSIALCMFVTFAAPICAQQVAPIDLDASAVSEQTLLQQFQRIQGRIDNPNQTASVLIQPAGRVWRYFHEVLLHWIGAAVILGMMVILATAYFFIGRLLISGGRSGTRVPRFNAFERFSHWLTAVSFVLLALTGLNITFGKIVLLPIIGAALSAPFRKRPNMFMTS